MDIKSALSRIAEHGHLDQEEMQEVMRQIMTGECTQAQIGAFLMGLRMKGEALEEISGAAQAMRELATPIHVDKTNLVDTCGTGGDGQNLFNISTASAFVVAAAGGRVAKHGNRGVSSKSGSADLLEQAGARLDLTPEEVERAIDTIGVGFLFAPAHHSAMRHAIGPRKELGMRTIFNMLGPLTNPAGVTRQVIGVFSDALCEPLARVLGRLGSEHVMVLHARDGLDEISLAAPTHIAELKDGKVTSWELRPEDVGIETQVLTGLDVDDPAASLALIQGALSGARNGAIERKAMDILALNAGAAIYVSGIATDLREGVLMAQDAMGSGLAAEKLREYVAFSRVHEGEEGAG
ncbi:MAG: anthranilate phosphoribosyltransferase [Natronospirillum sp.]|uniref:anthranilate phosphoribosyltransferase n=1 Tax=Natronospirillum sp. TaxID=2812955 RepID=UPI0025DEA53C|nr:anthranilate phosphoribosyltransferase [Natronospirillum sp.]MCH8552597.1 anthranilate phosphoribosyltransferase [Natronospirillum sp.]